MRRVRKYTFEVDFFKVKGQQFQIQTLAESLGFEARIEDSKTYYTLEYEDRKVDLHIDYINQVNQYQFLTERPDAESRVSKVKRFYSGLPSGLHIPEFSLTKGVRIINPIDFIKSHLSYLDGLSGRAREPYLDRLEAFAQIIRIELL